MRPATYVARRPGKLQNKEHVKKTLWDWYGRRTATNDASIRGVSTRCNLGPCSSLFRLDHNDRLLLALILHVPYSRNLVSITE